jgi:hypothetical protein
MKESAALRAIIRANFDAIREGRTLGEMQRDAYKYTDAGVSVSFELDDGTFLWSGDVRAYDPSMIDRVVKIGVSSIIEGSDTEVPLEWLDLADHSFLDEGGDVLAREAYERLLSWTNDEACAIAREEEEES